MKNVSGNPDYVTNNDLIKKKKETKRTQEKKNNDDNSTTNNTINNTDIKTFIENFYLLHEQCEKLYKIKSIKELYDIQTSLYSLKKDIDKVNKILKESN